jgi:MFS family permease
MGGRRLPGGAGCLLLIGGTLGDFYGHKRVVLTGLVVFDLGSLGCGLAPTTAVLIGARAVEGIGAAMLLPGGLAIIAHTYQHDRAGQARAIVGHRVASTARSAATTHRRRLIPAPLRAP